ncbi:tetratricopeptide repeat protein [Azospirillum halopraeferens]|uniref:tetratricopeptide repeat protein n=1 Tax=Azospirillum halopraeferens TaxID=34010 RepID=UPI000410770F|nr:tetratricopeptide repeat protein [Azospirillum halopraeferens]
MNRKERRAGAAGGNRAAAADPAAPLLAQGLALHRDGHAAPAEALYRQALAVRPGHPDALHLLGMLACGAGRFADAADLIGQAIAGNRTVPDYHANLAFALHALGRYEEAESACRRALRLRPGLPEAANTLGNALMARGRPAEAERAYREALRGRPAYAEAQGNLGAALRALGRAAEAEPVLRAALAALPGMAEARLALGRTLADLGRTEEAEADLRAARAARPDHAPTLAALAVTVERRGRTAEAAALQGRAIALVPDDGELWNLHGQSLLRLDRTAAAAGAYARAVRLCPGMAEALTNLGSVRREQGDPAGAAALHRRAAAARPGYAAAHVNLGLALQDLGDAAAAEAAFGAALTHDPAEGAAALNRALLRLRAGRLGEGWADYAGRPAGPGPALPEWTGGDIAGRHLLIRREQGLGDELMFASCYADAIARAGRVTIQCDRRLIPLFTRAFPQAAVQRPADDPADADLHVRAGSLPRVLRDRLGAFPPRPAWLTAEPQRVAERRARLADGAGPVVGIAWTSWRSDRTRRAAYTTLDQWGPLFAVPGVRFVSLQYDGRYDELAAAQRRFGVTIACDPADDLANDLETAAALTAACDLVVSVASAPGELAGALGVPVWRVCAPDWTHLGTAVRPWFPTMRPVPPPPGGTPGDALVRVARDLAALAGARR